MYPFKVSYIVYVVIAFLLWQSPMYAQTERKIKGQILVQDQPLQNVKISVEGKKAVSSTDSDGKYFIISAPGDILVYSHIGMTTVKVLVEDVTRILNVTMEPQLEQLDEVTLTVTKRRNLESEYAVNENIVKTSFGYIDRATSSGNIRVLGKERITPNNICILDLLKNNFGSLRVFGDCFYGGRVIVRSFNSISNPSSAVFDIDGLIIRDAPIWININDIERVAILSGLATTGLYGSFGAGGVIVINTKAGNTSTMHKTKEVQKLYNPNFFDGKALPFDAVSIKNAPEYNKALHASKTLSEAKTTYRLYSKSYAGFPYFFMDSFSYFMEKWNDKPFAKQIIEKHYDLFDKNPVLLKALAYLFEEKGFFEKATDIYTEIAKLRPNYLQSYLDLAASNINLNNPNRALDLYLRIDDLIQKDFFKVDSLRFDAYYYHETKSAFPLKPEYHFALVDQDQEEDFFEGDTRFVFEWNDGEAEFQIQFVGPSGQFTTWKHTHSKNSELILNEKKLGFNSKEFFIDDILEGQWKINLVYLGNKSLTPTYLKVKIYENYGTPLQHKKTKVFKLALKEINQELFSISKIKNLTSTN
ncbi:carboxypeptidase-like regulatory domain-containing protein [Flagellimonas sp. S3867]|uniref:carboxypeptidase-like regulatory domain-containing protein n=1 Tax=Flagellimonas sp. S3867 TaxID=2768063 RepID=UPI00168633AD|nr:carboxypeptidase-like regulatory domain-containing protein [Flagellimonas sp. S3867]